VVFVKKVVVLSEGPWPLGNVGAELLERVCHPGGDDGQIRDRLGVDGANPVHLAGAGAEMLAIAAPDDSRLSRFASRTVAADSRYGARYPPKWSAT